MEAHGGHVLNGHQTKDKTSWENMTSLRVYRRRHFQRVYKLVELGSFVLKEDGVNRTVSRQIGWSGNFMYSILHHLLFCPYICSTWLSVLSAVYSPLSGS